MISPATGPGVIGVLQSNIVVPEWVCALEQELQNLIVSHEQEHRRAHDLLLVFLGLAAVVVFPWNAALWWQLRRIKLAIEIDCDRRVLGRGTSLRAYAELLVASAEYQVTRLQPGAMALADSRSQLERRIEDMTRSNVRSRGPRTVVHAVAAIALVAVACDTPLPEAPELSKQELDQNDEAEGLLFVHRDSTKIKVFIRADQSQAAHTEKPLYVVDGVILSGDFAKLAIETADIESIEVVKGAAAEELYGTRAANGVIHIVTKDGAVEQVVDLVRIKERPDSGN
jgi:TonB-dependent SusC/RagA subfamily outer membrane receptor